MLELAVLGLLTERPLHGYELRKQLSQRLGLFWSVSFGSLYPTLTRLERRGDVEKVASADTASRRKQAYRITPQGEQRFMELLEEGPKAAEDDKFRLRVAFFRHLGPEARLRQLERRRAVLIERLSERERSLERAQHSGTDAYTVSLLQHGVTATAHDLHWLDDLIAAERAALRGEPPRAPRSAGDVDDDEQNEPGADDPTPSPSAVALERGDQDARSDPTPDEDPRS